MTRIKLAQVGIAQARVERVGPAHFSGLMLRHTSSPLPQKKIAKLRPWLPFGAGWHRGCGVTSLLHKVLAKALAGVIRSVILKLKGFP